MAYDYKDDSEAGGVTLGPKAALEFMKENKR